MNRANEIRPVFRRLGSVAERTGCAIVIVGHMNKAVGLKGIHKSIGSVDISAVARSILVVGRLKSDDETRYFAQLKNNLAPMGKSVIFEINDTLQFTGTSDVTGEQIVSGISYGEGFKSTKTNCAIEELTKLLSNGELPCSEIYEHFEKMSISRRTVENAKKELGVRSRKHGANWHWTLV